MKFLVLGASGMAGHMITLYLTENGHDVTGFDLKKISYCKSIVGDARDTDYLKKIIDEGRFDSIINCVGILNQFAEQYKELAVFLNSYLPHFLAKITDDTKTHIIHMSTDCVFSGHTGNYAEDDLSDAEDLYGKTKFLGEVDYPGCLTIRTSIIGRELNTAHGLVEWFLSQEGKTVPGYKKAIFSGLTTFSLSEIISKIISDYPDIRGIRQIASEPISKYDLLNLVKKTYGLTTAIEPDVTVINNRTLNAEKFKRETNIKIPSWEYMIDQMHRDSTPYEKMRHYHAHE